MEFHPEPPQIGFHLGMQNLPAFGQVSIGGLKLILSGRGASGSRPMPDGRQQEPGGWNRVVLQVQDLPVRIADLKEAGVRFRNDMEVGPGGKQIQIEDPDGNPILSSSSLLAIEELQNKRLNQGGYQRLFSSKTTELTHP